MRLPEINLPERPLAALTSPRLDTILSPQLTATSLNATNPVSGALRVCGALTGLDPKGNICVVSVLSLVAVKTNSRLCLL